MMIGIWFWKWIHCLVWLNPLFADRLVSHLAQLIGEGSWKPLLDREGVNDPTPSVTAQQLRARRTWGGNNLQDKQPSTPEARGLPYEASEKECLFSRRSSSFVGASP